jgi:hypothetical protein
MITRFGAKPWERQVCLSGRFSEICARGEFQVEEEVFVFDVGCAFGCADALAGRQPGEPGS